jgi:hypothetical protein
MRAAQYGMGEEAKEKSNSGWPGAITRFIDLWDKNPKSALGLALVLLVLAFVGFLAYQRFSSHGDKNINVDTNNGVIQQTN